MENNIIIDIDENSYKVIQIGKQLWTAGNLNVSKYRNGDEIPQVQDINEWKKLTTGAWCYYENNEKNGVIYGKLYNWYAVSDPRGLAPDGYQIPSHEDWKTLIANLGGDFIAGSKMKEKGSTHWEKPNKDASNDSGFTALPAGRRWEEENFNGLGEVSEFWTTKEFNSEVGGALKLTSTDKNALLSVSIKNTGCSVRCIKNSIELITGYRIDNLEIFNKSFGELSYNDAYLACAKIGNDWRLPTIDELIKIFNNKDSLGLDENGYYWSSNESSGSGFGLVLSFSDGLQYPLDRRNKKNKSYVIAVKSL